MRRVANGRAPTLLGRLFGLLLILLCIWTGVEIYTKGTAGAFGGLFSRFSEDLNTPAQRSTHDRAADAFQRAYNKSEERVDRLLRQQDPGQ
jgi:hypothetical protein